MQDPSSAFYAQMNPTFPEQEQLKCPRCDSSNTKFCYYNNYNLSQPRHFCKSCKRYWTKGGALRNIPVGGASRKNTKRSSINKKPSSSSSSSSSASSSAAIKAASIASCTTSASSTAAASSTKSSFDQGSLDVSGNFTTLLGSSIGGQFGNLVVDGLGKNGSTLELGKFGGDGNLGSGETRNDEIQMDLQNVGDGENNNNNNNNSSCWNGVNGWPGLAIHTPGSSYLSKG